VLLLQIENVGIDVSLGALFFEENAVRRASKFEFLKNISLKTCSAEDLIVYKAFADRLQDWADIQNILSVQTKLDWAYRRAARAACRTQGSARNSDEIRKFAKVIIKIFLL
jgi:hypothetical protein